MCHSYSVAEAALQAAVLGHLGQSGFTGACSALPLRDTLPPPASRFVTTTHAGTCVCAQHTVVHSHTVAAVR